MFSFFLFFVSSANAVTWEGVPPGYGLAWSDEFNGSIGSAPNSANWWANVGTNFGDGEIENCTNSVNNAMIVSDPNAVDGKALGIILIDTKPGSSNYADTNRYTSARLQTANTSSHTTLSAPQYGYFVARIHFPYGQGIGPSWWMLGGDYVTGTAWPECGEIDILENGFGGTSDAANCHGSLHYPNNSQTSSLTKTSVDSLQGGQILANDYHTYAVWVQANEIQFFLDGNLYQTVNNNGSFNGIWEFNQSDFMILGLGLGGSEPNPDASTSFPATMFVDYTRVYQTGLATPTPVVQSSWYVACGDESNYVSPNSGITWVADTNFGFQNGAVDYRSHTVSNTTDSQLYQFSRYVNSTTGSAITYTFSVPIGTTYQVTLKFSENDFSSSGVREFDYSINGTTETSNFDIYNDAGGEYVADDKVFNNISPDVNGQIVLRFSNDSAYEAEINAIQIIPMSQVPTPTPTNTPCGYPGNTCTPTDTPTVTNTPTPLPITVPVLYPNPYHGSGPLTLLVPLKEASDIHVAIFTLAFRKILDQTFTQQAAGEDNIHLDLTDKNRNLIANGLYYVRVITAEGQDILKLLVLY